MCSGWGFGSGDGKYSVLRSRVSPSLNFSSRGASAYSRHMPGSDDAHESTLTPRHKWRVRIILVVLLFVFEHLCESVLHHAKSEHMRHLLAEADETIRD